jgi:hypothetical protein
MTDTLLLAACGEGNIDEVGRLLSEGIADVGAANVNG